MVRNGYDETQGTIIGGEYFTGKIFYDNRQQGNTITADTHEELIIQAEQIVSDYKEKFCGFPCYLYTDNSKWELRIN